MSGDRANVVEAGHFLDRTCDDAISTALQLSVSAIAYREGEARATHKVVSHAHNKIPCVRQGLWSDGIEVQSNLV